MLRTQHPSNNRVFGAPDGWDQRDMACDALPVTVGTHSGIPVVKSYWLPSAEELKLLAAGHYLQVMVVGETTPPLRVTVEP